MPDACPLATPLEFSFAWDKDGPRLRFNSAGVPSVTIRPASMIPTPVGDASRSTALRVFARLEGRVGVASVRDRSHGEEVR